MKIISNRHVNATGLVITFVGACVGAFAMMMPDDQAARVALSAGVVVGPSFEQAVANNPAVQNMIAQSHAATLGLALIAVGSVFQFVAIYLKD